MLDLLVGVTTIWNQQLYYKTLLWVVTLDLIALLIKVKSVWIANIVYVVFENLENVTYKYEQHFTLSYIRTNYDCLSLIAFASDIKYATTLTHDEFWKHDIGIRKNGGS